MVDGIFSFCWSTVALCWPLVSPAYTPSFPQQEPLLPRALSAPCTVTLGCLISSFPGELTASSANIS